MNQRMIILKEIAICADQFRSESEKLGIIANEAFKGTKHSMRSLENIANSAMKVSDVLNYIKRQTGKSEKTKQWKKDEFGSELLKIINELILNRRERICQQQNITSEETRLEVYLLLIREFIRQLVVYYEYESGK